MTIRPAAAADIGAIVDLHVESWRSAYRGVLPDDFLDGPIEQERRNHWDELMNGPDGGRIVLVAEDAGRLAGFAAAGRSGDPGFDAYIEHLHVRPGLTGAGTGRRLLAAAVDRLLAIGCRSAYLLVLDGNRQAIGFYEGLGGVTERLGLDDFAGLRVRHSRVSWGDIAVLAVACRRRD